MTKDTTITKEKKGTKKFLRDYYATKLLRDKDSKDYLIAIIAAALKLEPKDIEEDFELVDIKLGLSENSKNSEADLVAQNKDFYYNIEINYSVHKIETDYKNISYICALVLKQLKPGKINRYKDLKPIIQINLNDYDQFKDERFIYVSRYFEEESMKPRDNLTKIIDINLEYLSELEYTDVKKLKENSLERLLYIFVCEDKLVLDGLYVGDILMEKIKSKLYDLSSNIDDYFYYDKEELLKEESYSLGVEHGMEKTRIENAKALIANGVDKELVIKTLKLNDNEIKQLEP